MKWLGRLVAVLSCISCAIFITSCGGSGGPSDASKAKCADFAFQEDAQEYFRTHDAPQLDADHDGVACEALPHRPKVTTPPEPTSPAGLYQGTTNTQRTLTGLVLDTNRYWVIYSAVANPLVVAGVIEGDGTSSSGSFASSNALDFNVESKSISAATISASYMSRQTFNGIVMYGLQNVSFASSYSSDYETGPSLSSLAGRYGGSAATLSGTDITNLTVAANGAIDGLGTSGCRFNGQASPHSQENVYDITVTFQGGACSNGTSTVTGVAFFNPTSKQLYGVALNAQRTSGLIFVGVRS